MPTVTTRSIPYNGKPPAPKGTRYPYAYPLSFTAAGLGVLGANAGVGTGNIIGYPGQRWSFLNIGFASDYPFLIQLSLTRLGGSLFNAPISSETLLGPLDRPGMLPHPIELEGSESIQVQLTNNAPNTTSTNTVYLTFWGFRDLMAC